MVLPLMMHARHVIEQQNIKKTSVIEEGKDEEDTDDTDDNIDQLIL